MNNDTTWWKLAKFEAKLGLRNRFPMINSILVALLQLFALGISSGSTGLTAASAFSSIQLGLLLITLTAVQFGVFTFRTDRRENELLLTIPVERSSVFLGRFAGNGAVYLLSIEIGFVVPVLFLAIFETSQVSAYLFVVVNQIFIAISFYTVGTWIGLRIKNRLTALLFATAVWLIATSGGDLIALLLTTWFNGAPYRTMFFSYILINPIAGVRSVCALVLGGEAVYGAGGVIFVRWFGTETTACAIVLIITVLWSAVFGIVSLNRFRKTEFD